MSDADNLDIKKRARRRLVGAIALALLAAVVLPLMMEQEPHQFSQDIQISIPDRGDAARTRPIAGDGAGAAVAEIAPAPQEEPPSAAEAAPPAAAVPPAASARTPAAPAAPATAARAPAPATPAAAAPASPAAKAATPARDAQEEARARAALEGRAPPPRADSFILQVGAFGDAAVANRVMVELKSKGFAAYTEKAGKFTRVRIGPVAGREAAERLAARLKDSGHSAAVIAR